jgi:exodeoxyribonuclease-3
LLALLERELPDFVCLQETKTLNDEFPIDQLAKAGYVTTSYGQRPFNGVATLSRTVPDCVIQGFPGDPTPDDARLLATRFGQLTVVNVYVINGRDPADPAYQLKLDWLAALHAWIADSFDPADNLIVAGDFNIAPNNGDVHDPARWRDEILCTEPERRELQRLLKWGLSDLVRDDGIAGGDYTWWDYRAGAFHRGWGLRLDLVLGTGHVADSCTEVRIDRNERRPNAGEGKPSDHAPVIVTFQS